MPNSYRRRRTRYVGRFSLSWFLIGILTATLYFVMVATYQGWLKESEGRLQFVLQALPPAPQARRPWWRIW